MQTLVVVTHRGDWPLELADARLVTDLEYLTSPELSSLRHAKVFNLCRQYRYQSRGYYVSLLAEARGHRPFPSVLTMQDLRSPALVRMASDELEELIQKSLPDDDPGPLVVDIYFGRTVDGRLERLATALFKQFPAPFLRAQFLRGDEWELHRIAAIPTSSIPEDERAFAYDSAARFFARPPRLRRPAPPPRFDLAILYEPGELTAPSDPAAIERFLGAAEQLAIEAEVIGREDYGRLLEYDALFIRATTAVNHYTYRFARRAQAEGLVVIDDPLSILRCTNKVYLAELLARHGVPAPRTRIIHRDGRASAADGLGFPCIVKQPDSSTSLGVHKADDPAALQELLDRLFATSDLLLVQEFMPTAFDWRVGVLDRRALFVAKYFMAPHHWQVIKHEPKTGTMRWGRWEVLRVEDAPPEGVGLAVRAANLIGDGLYGVDLKETNGRWSVIEINDNPNVEHQVEDLVLKDEIYRRIMGSFLRRLEEVTAGPRSS